MAKKKEKVRQQQESASNTKVALLGAGKMGGILLQAFLKNGLFRPENIRATVQHPERAEKLAEKWGVSVSTDNLAAARNSDLILLGVKPQTVPEVLEQIRSTLTAKKTIISFAAS
ncbi:MAG: NAD(P)-binding domain-containing protein, partial [Acidobacteriota bacterium]